MVLTDKLPVPRLDTQSFLFQIFINLERKDLPNKVIKPEKNSFRLLESGWVRGELTVCEMFWKHFYFI